MKVELRQDQPIIFGTSKIKNLFKR